jgi:hypothetical protein
MSSVHINNHDVAYWEDVVGAGKVQSKIAQCVERQQGKSGGVLL